MARQSYTVQELGRSPFGPPFSRLGWEARRVLRLGPPERAAARGGAWQAVLSGDGDMRRLSMVAGAVLLWAWAPEVHAGGYDTPMLYTARHLGMGGAAVGYVDDPSALFHNPAGLGHTGRLSLMGDFSLLVGTIHGSPEDGPGENQESNTTVAPFFLVGGSVRILDWLSAGLAVYPVA